jgi:hypothetical protein
MVRLHLGKLRYSGRMVKQCQGDGSWQLLISSLIHLTVPVLSDAWIRRRFFE